MKIEYHKTDKIAVKTWVNDSPITTTDWEVYTHESEDEYLLMLVDPKTKNKMRINIEKVISFTEIEQ